MCSVWYLQMPSKTEITFRLFVLILVKAADAKVIMEKCGASVNLDWWQIELNFYLYYIIFSNNMYLFN